MESNPSVELRKVRRNNINGEKFDVSELTLSPFFFFFFFFFFFLLVKEKKIASDRLNVVLFSSTNSLSMSGLTGSSTAPHATVTLAHSLRVSVAFFDFDNLAGREKDEELMRCSCDVHFSAFHRSKPSFLKDSFPSSPQRR